MNTYIHLIWQALPGHTPTSVQLSFMKFTAQQIKFELIKEQSPMLEPTGASVQPKVGHWCELNQAV